jgi:hypothetical protein
MSSRGSNVSGISLTTIRLFTNRCIKHQWPVLIRSRQRIFLAAYGVLIEGHLSCCRSSNVSIGIAAVSRVLLAFSTLCYRNLS